MERRKIAIIGGGLSGSLLGIHLLKYHKNSPLELFIYEKSPDKLCRGIAYASALPYQLLNVPVKGMSLFEEDPLHFLDWLIAHHIRVEATDFVSRKLFGDYVADTFQLAVNNCKNHKVNIINHEVTDLLDQENHIKVVSPGHRTIAVSKVFLCTGNFPPPHLPGLSEELIRNPRYVTDPWSGAYLERVSSDDTVLIVGTGLTMVDQVMSLFKTRQFCGQVIALSRNGYLPLAHGEAPVYQPKEMLRSDGCSLPDVYRWFRTEVSLAEEQGKNYRSVLDAIRPLLPEIWGKLSLKDKARFMRHLRPFWEIHRHRIPENTAAFIRQLIGQKKLTILAGRIQQVKQGNEGSFRLTYCPRGQDISQYIDAKWLINAIGPQSDHKKINSALYRNLLDAGTVITDEFSLGIRVLPGGVILGPNGLENHRLLVVGPPAKGTFWESTALREIRAQVRNISQQLSGIE